MLRDAIQKLLSEFGINFFSNIPLKTVINVYSKER